MTYGLQRYQSAKTKTASREDILIMLYEGAIRFLEQSIQALEADNLSEHKRLLGRGRAIIEEFQNTLDVELAGELGVALFDLYQYMLTLLSRANITRDMASVREVIGLLQTLLDGWRDAVAQVKQQGGVEALAATVAAEPPAGGEPQP